MTESGAAISATQLVPPATYTLVSELTLIQCQQSEVEPINRPNGPPKLSARLVELYSQTIDSSDQRKQKSSRISERSLAPCNWDISFPIASVNTFAMAEVWRASIGLLWSRSPNIISRLASIDP